MKTLTQLYARSQYHTQLAKMSFGEIFDLTAGVYFDFSLYRGRSRSTPGFPLFSLQTNVFYKHVFEMLCPVRIDRINTVCLGAEVLCV